MGSEFVLPADLATTSWRRNLHVESAGPMEQYIYAIEFAVMAMVFAYGSVKPVGAGQRGFALCCMFAGGAVYVYIVGAVCEAVSAVDPASTMFKQTMDTLNTYLSEIRCDELVPPPDHSVHAFPCPLY